MFKFITKQPFWVNVLAAVALGLIIIFTFLKMLGILTKHGEYLLVPAVTGMPTQKAIDMLEKQGFAVEIQDSIYTDTAAKGIVLKQLPDPNSTVKINRTVFITVNRVVPPMIDMPKLEGQNLSFALMMLERNHLKLEDTIYRPDFMMGSVLEQLHNGVRIPEKAKIQWGSKITLVIGGGLDNKQIPVPDLTGFTFAEAKAILDENGIGLGALIPDGVLSDTASAFVFKQLPERFDIDRRLQYIQSGQVMDLWISQTQKTIVDSLRKKNTP